MIYALNSLPRLDLRRARPRPDRASITPTRRVRKPFLQSSHWHHPLPKFLVLLFVFFCFSIPLIFVAHSAFAESQETIFEIERGNYADRIITQNFVLLDSPALSSSLQEIVGSFIPYFYTQYPERYPIRIKILNTPVINAGATAGGNIYITTGMLDFAESRDEIAAVLAHELAHIFENDATDFEKSAHYSVRAGISALAFGATVAGTAVAQRTAKSTKNAGAAFGAGLAAALLTARLGGTLLQEQLHNYFEGYKQDDELDADRIAYIAIREAGFDANAMISFFKRWYDVEKPRGDLGQQLGASAFFNAAPGVIERLDSIQEIDPQAQRVR